MMYGAEKGKGGLHVKTTKLSGKTIGSSEGAGGKGKRIVLGKENKGTSKLDASTKGNK
jgi:hypothetical protein